MYFLLVTSILQVYKTAARAAPHPPTTPLLIGPRTTLHEHSGRDVSVRHTLLTPPFIEPLPKRMTKLLTTPVRVNDQTRLRLTLLEGLSKGLHN